MTDSSSPPPPPGKPPAPPRRIVRGEHDHPANAEPAGRDRSNVGQRVLEQRPDQRRPSVNTEARGSKPDLRDLPPPRRDTPANVWRADAPKGATQGARPGGVQKPSQRALHKPAPAADVPSDARSNLAPDRSPDRSPSLSPNASRDAERQERQERHERRGGPRRAHGDAPRPDRAGERRAGSAPHRPAAPWQDRGHAPRREVPSRQDGAPPRTPSPTPFRQDDRRATGYPPGPPRERPADDRRGGSPPPRHDDPRPSARYNGTRDDQRGASAVRNAERPGTPEPSRRSHAERRPVERVPNGIPNAPRTAPDQVAPQPGAPRREDQRLSKVLAERGVASRREADDWIDAGWVRVDGEMAVLGARVFPHQTIAIDPAAKTQQAHRVTILIHKPIGYVSGQAEDGYEPAIVLVNQANHWAEDPARETWHPGHVRGIAPAGRLDIDSTGLLVMTQDGRIARHLIGEDSDVEKEYLVRVEYPRGGPLPDNDLERLRHGLWLDGRELRPAKVSWANEDQLRVVLREGRKRQIRRMCEAVGLVVTGLKRVRIGSVVLGKLPLGQWRYLREDERF